MIAQPQWFQRRKYLGWGACPKTWQGWIYLVVFVIIILGIQLLPINAQIKLVLTLFLVGILIVDTALMMPKLSKDERDKKHEAIAERNALWAILGVLVIGVGYQVASNVVNNKIYADPFIVAAIIMGLLVKSISNFYLDKRD